MGQAERLEHESSIHCDALVSIPKSALTDYAGELSIDQIEVLGSALRVALDIE